MIKKDIQDNIVYVSHGYGVETQFGNEFSLGDFHYITDNPWRESEAEGVDITFKIRHTPEFIKGKLFREEDRYRILSSRKAAKVLLPDNLGWCMMNWLKYVSGVVKLFNFPLIKYSIPPNSQFPPALHIWLLHVHCLRRVSGIYSYGDY